MLSAFSPGKPVPALPTTVPIESPAAVPRGPVEPDEPFEDGRVAGDDVEPLPDPAAAAVELVADAA